MRWNTGLAVLAFFGTLVPIAEANHYNGCVPSQWPAKQEVTVGSTRYYYLQYSQGTYTYTEVWRESNGQPGLQLTTSQACGNEPDTKMFGICTIRCPIPL